MIHCTITAVRWTAVIVRQDLSIVYTMYGLSGIEILSIVILSMALGMYIAGMILSRKE